jgi:hypothetical protein
MAPTETSLADLSALLRDGENVITPYVRDPDEEPVLGALAAAGPRAEGAADEYTVLIEAIREGYLLHYERPRLIEGADVQEWPIGQRLRAGGALFEITMVCDPCERMEAIRPGLRAELDGRRGMLARVVESGDVTPGDAITLL